MTKYTWNRNSAHHRIAMTRFSVIAFIQSVFVGLLTTLSMGINSDGTRSYIVTTAIMGLIGVIVTYLVFFAVMGAMYQWILETDKTDGKPTKEKQPEDVWIQPFYQKDTGWEAGEPVKKRVGWGGKNGKEKRAYRSQ